MHTDTSTAMRKAGRRISGRYRLGGRIGQGGMATVYRATDEQLDRPVALKVMRAGLGDDTHFVRRFTAEARRAASVVHPNVVAVYDVGVDRRPYMVMELVEGGDLAGLLRREGHLEPAHAARLVADAADAVAAAHSASIVHRDIKPGNILIGADGRAMVADFGIARATGEESLTRTGAALGSVDYFSPEQARGKRAGPPSDVYALGVVLFELLTGRRPFGGETPYAIATARIDAPVPDPRVIVPSLPADLARIAMEAMAPEANARPTADQLGDLLRAWLEVEDSGGALAAPSTGTAILGTPVVDAESAAPAGRRRTRMSRLLLLVVTLAGLAGIGFLVGSLAAGKPSGGGLPGVIVGSPGGEAFDIATPSPTPAAPPSDSPVPTQTLSATTAPVVTTPPPTPAPTIAPTPPPSPVPIAVGPPDDTVAAFYAYVESGRFDAAYALWSDRMKAQYPRQENLDDRFAHTADITFSALFIAEQSGDRATVQANFTETYDSGSSRDFVGYWQLVLENGRWLLDQPTY